MKKGFVIPDDTYGLWSDLTKYQYIENPEEMQA